MRPIQSQKQPRLISNSSASQYLGHNRLSYVISHRYQPVKEDELQSRSPILVSKSGYLINGNYLPAKQIPKLIITLDCINRLDDNNFSKNLLTRNESLKTTSWVFGEISGR